MRGTHTKSAAGGGPKDLPEGRHEQGGGAAEGNDKGEADRQAGGAPGGLPRQRHQGVCSELPQHVCLQRRLAGGLNGDCEGKVARCARWPARSVRCSLPPAILHCKPPLPLF